MGTAPISVVSGTTTVSTAVTGVFQLWVDAYAMAKGDNSRSRFRKRSGDRRTRKAVFVATLSDVQSEVWVSPMLILMNGWNMTIHKVAGTDRAFDASLRKVA